MKSEWIDKDDDWGIRQSVYELFHRTWKKVESNISVKEKFSFDVFFNQFLPPTYRETRSTVIRHIDQIEEIIHHQYQYDWVWINRNGSFACATINDGILDQIKRRMVRLPIYLEIEEEKKRWQQTSGYDKEQGFSNPIKEEYVQLVIKKK